MSERDAFGNIIDNGPAATTATAPAPCPAPVAVGSAPVERVKGTWDVWDKLAGLFFAAIFVVPLAIGGWFAYSTWHDTKDVTGAAIKGITNATASAPQQPQASSPAASAVPRGLSTKSMLKPAAVTRVATAAGGRLRLLRLAPERADLQLARRGGGMDLVQLRYDGGRTVVHTPGTAPGKPIAAKAIDAHAPQRLVTAAAHRLHRSTKAIDYVVLLRALDAPTWNAYFKGGAAFQGDAHGRITRRIQ